MPSAPGHAAPPPIGRRHPGAGVGRARQDGRVTRKAPPPTPGRARPVLARHARVVRLGVRGARRPAQVGAWDAISSGQHALVVAPTGSGKTLAAFLWALDRRRRRSRCPTTRGALPGALRLAAQGARRRRRAQPAQPAHRHPPRGRAARAARARRHRRGPLRRHPGRRAPALRHAPARHPHHHARVAVPPAHLAGARLAARRHDRDRRRGARGRRHQARRAPRDLARAARRPARAARAAHRPVGHGAAGRGGRAVPRRRATRHRRAAAGSTKTFDLEVVVPGRRHGRARRERPARSSGSAAGDAQRTSIWPHVEERVVDLDRRAPVDDRVRQLPPPRRAAHRAAQRDLGRAPRPARRSRPASAPAASMGQAGLDRRRARRCSPAPTTAR